MPGFFGIAALVSTGLSLIQGNEARQDAKKGNRIQEGQVRLENRQRIREFMRNYRQQLADAITQAQVSGVSLESSGIQGVRGSLRSQREQGAALFNEQQRLGIAANDKFASAQKRGFYSQVAGQVGQALPAIESLIDQTPTLKPIKVTAQRKTSLPNVNTSAFNN
jgi:hypothetical protein